MQNNLTSRLTSTRGGAIALGVLAAIIAAVLLVVYITHYRSSVKSDTAPLQVLLAKRLIPAGTTGTEIGKKQLYTLTSVPQGARFRREPSRSGGSQRAGGRDGHLPRRADDRSNFSLRGER